jgi:hypothetical protein
VVGTVVSSCSVVGFGFIAIYMTSQVFAGVNSGFGCSVHVRGLFLGLARTLANALIHNEFIILRRDYKRLVIRVIAVWFESSVREDNRASIIIVRRTTSFLG